MTNTTGRMLDAVHQVASVLGCDVRDLFGMTLRQAFQSVPAHVTVYWGCWSDVDLDSAIGGSAAISRADLDEAIKRC